MTGRQRVVWSMYPKIFMEMKEIKPRGDAHPLCLPKIRTTVAHSVPGRRYTSAHTTFIELSRVNSQRNFTQNKTGVGAENKCLKFVIIITY